MKYVLVTGGVVSGLGKGVTASSIGVLMKACGLRVTSIKIDPYLNMDAGTMSPFEHGEVFVLDMGEPVRIHDLAVNMIRLSGLEVRDAEHPAGDIEIVYSGLRPGEKLFEELLIGDDVSMTRHDRIMTSKERFWEWPRLEAFLNELEQALVATDHVRIRQLLESAPLDYHPLDEIADLVWKARQDMFSDTRQQRLKVKPVLSSPVRPDPILSPVSKEGDMPLGTLGAGLQRLL
jgi:hypothetical protein